MGTDDPQTDVSQRTSRTSAYLKALKLPAAFLLVGVCLIAAYYSLYVSSSLEYLKGRDLRFLLTLESEIQAALDGHETVLSSFANYYVRSGKSDRIRCIPEDSAAKWIPMFAYIVADPPTDTNQTSLDCGQGAARTVDAKRPPAAVQTRFIDDAGTTWTRSAGVSPRRDPANVVSFRIGLSQLLEPVFSHQLGEDAFDLLLLLTPSGRVIYWHGSSEVRLTSLDSIVRRDAENKWKKLPFTGLGRSSQVLDVQISGEEYVLYLQPCCVNFRDSSTVKEPGWVVAGLTKRSAIRNSSLAVSFSVMALTGGLILLAVFSWPFLKLTLIGRDRRLRLIDVLAVGICSLLGMALIVLFVADWYAYGQLKEDLDRQLIALSRRIERNVGQEIASAYKQMAILDQWSARDSRDTTERTPSVFQQDGLGERENATYPFFESFALIDSTGWQRNKWSSLAFTTPLVRTQSREYFRHWQNQVPRALTAGPARTADDTSDVYANTFLESIRSATTGGKEAVLSAPVDANTSGRTTNKIMIAAMTVPMRSLNDVALPPGFKFAVIDSGGLVLFHSHPHHSLVEQFFLETDRSRRLRASIAARHAEVLNVRYLGQDFRAYVAPLQGINGSAWSLVTLFDRQLLRTVNIEWVITTMLFTVIYASLYVALCIVVVLFRPAYRAPWVWPDSGKQAKYHRLVAVYGLFGIAFVLAMFSVRGTRLLAIAWTLPVIVWMTTYLTVTRGQRRKVERSPEHHDGSGRNAAPQRHEGRRRLRRVVPSITCAFRPRWGAMACGLTLSLLLFAVVSGRDSAGMTVWATVTAGVVLSFAPIQRREGQPYIRAAMLLLVVTAALPTLAAFVVAHAIQVDSYIKYGQLSLAKQVQRRLNLAEPAARFENRQRTLEREWGRYGQFFYGSEVVDATDTLARVTTCGLPPGAKEDPRHDFPKLLEDLLPFYSESSVGMRELLHDQASDSAWDWHRKGDTLVLHAQRKAGWNVACVRSQLPTFANAGLSSIGDPGRVTEVAVLLLLAAYAVAWIARFAARRIFLIEVIEPFWARHAATIPVHPGEHLYVVWRSADRNARTLVGDEMHVVDLGGLAGDQKDFEAARDALEQLPTGQTVVIDHLEARIGNQAFDASKFELVRDALDVQHRTVVLVSGVRPGSLVARIVAASGADSTTVERRWSALLRRFTVLDGVRFNGPGSVTPVGSDAIGVNPPAEAASSSNGEPATAPGPGSSGDPYDPDTDPLVELVFPKADQHRSRDASSGAPLGPEQILEEADDRLDNYNRGIWESCSDAQKLVLLHLANEGLVNEKNRRTVRQLLARGLIRKNPNFRFANDTFRRFVLSRIPTPEVAEIEQHSTSAWDAVRLPFLITLMAVSAFFFLTQRELFTTTVAVITALAGGIPSLVRVVGIFERKPDAPRPA